MKDTKEIRTLKEELWQVATEYAQEAASTASYCDRYSSLDIENIIIEKYNELLEEREWIK